MTITEALETILGARYGREVRQAIHDGIKQAYEDGTANGNANMEVSQARGSYPTLATRLTSIVNTLEKKIAKGQVTMADLTQEVKEALTGGSVAVVGEGAVGYENTNFISASRRNLYDESTRILDKNVNWQTGELVYSEYTDTTDKIRVYPGKQYYITQSFNIAFFDADGNYVSGMMENFNDNKSPRVITVPNDPNIFYLQTTFAKSVGNNMVLEGAEAPTEYIPYGQYDLSVDTKLKDAILTPKSVTNEILAEKSVSPINTDFITYAEPIRKIYESIRVSDYHNVSNDGKILMSNGTSASSPATTDYTYATAIPVVESMTYSVSYRNVIIRNEKGTVLKFIDNDNYSASQNKRDVTMPTGAKTVDVTLYITAVPTDTIERVSAFDSEKEIVIPRLKITSSLKLQGKKGLYLGTSLGADTQYAVTRADLIASETGAILVNGALGGSRATSWKDSKQANSINFGSSGVELIDSIISGDFKIPRDDINARRTGTLLTKQLATIDRIEAIDFNQLDFIIIEYGTNDLLQSVKLGEIDYTKSTFKGALSYMIKELATNYPHIKVLLVTAPYTAVHETEPNSNGLITKDYVNATLEVGQATHVKVCDLYTDGQINDLNQSYYFNDTDRIHGKEETFVPLHASMIIERLNEMF